LIGEDSIVQGSNISRSKKLCLRRMAAARAMRRRRRRRNKQNR
jgi:hypothetical protein